MSQEDFYKAICITSAKHVNIIDLENSQTLKDYNDLVLVAYELTQEEFNLLKEVTDICQKLKQAFISC